VHASEEVESGSKRWLHTIAHRDRAAGVAMWQRFRQAGLRTCQQHATNPHAGGLHLPALLAQWLRTQSAELTYRCGGSAGIGERSHRTGFPFHPNHYVSGT